MSEYLLNQLKISPYQWRIFFLTCIAMFIIVSLHYLGIQSPIRVPSVSVSLPHKGDIMQTITPKLKQKQNTFLLKNQQPLIVQAYATSDYDQAKAYIVVDLDNGNVLASKNSREQLSIASLTKIMTSIVALDLVDPSTLLTVANEAINVVPTRAGIVSGQKMTVEELLNGALLTSANDAAEEIRDGIDAKFNSNVFINAMNVKADFLGLKSTHFANPEGFDSPENYSSASDLAILAEYALSNYPLIKTIVKKDYQFLAADSNHKQFDLYNWNGLLGVYPNIEGMKIGNTRNAGYTTVVVSSRGGKNIMAIVLGAPGIIERDMWASELLDVGYQKTLNLQPVAITEDDLRAKYATWKYWN